MPIIQEESDSFSMKMEQKLNFNKAKLAISRYHDAVTAKKADTDMFGHKISAITVQKIKQNEDARISKMAEHMAKMTDDTISKFEQIHDEPSMNVLKQTRLIEQLNLSCFQ